MVASVRQNLNNAGIKVTDLPVATVPLDGTEVIMLVQAGLSAQTPVSNLTIGATGYVLYAAAAGASNDVTPVGFGLNTRFLDVDTTLGNAQFTGLIAGQHGQRIVLTCLGPNQLRLDGLNGGSLAANQFREAGNLILLTNMTTELIYCSLGGVNKWLVIT